MLGFAKHFLFLFIFLMISRRTIISESTDRFSQSFHTLKAVWVQMIFLKGRTLPWQPFLWKNGKLSSFVETEWGIATSMCALTD